MTMPWGGFHFEDAPRPSSEEPHKAMLRRNMARRVGEDKTEQVTGKLQLYAIRAASRI